MADTSNGLIYGLDEVKFGSQTIGWIDQNGLQPAGSEPQYLDVFAVQVHDGPVESIMTNPGSEAFTFNLIKLNAEGLVAVIGGEKGSKDEWTPPAVVSKVDKMDIKTRSGHTIRIPKARLTKSNMQNGLNMSNVLAFKFRVDYLKPDGDGERYTIYPPGVDPDAGV